MASSLQARLLVAVGSLVLVGVLAVALVSRHGARLDFLRFQAVERTAERAMAPALADRVMRALDGKCCAAAAIRAASAELDPGQVILVTDPGAGGLLASAGRPVAAYDHLSTRRDGTLLAVEATRGTGARQEQIGLRFNVAGTPLRLEDGGPALLYVVPFPDDARERNAADFLGSLDRRLAAVTVLVAGLALLATWLLARSVVRPLRALCDATSALTRGDLAARVSPGGSREVDELARAFNAMAEELARQQELRRGLVHDVAHELRTPLTALRCRIETVVDGLAPDPARAVRDLHEEVLHLGRLVDDLQEVALAEARELRLDLGDVRLAEVVESAARATGLDADPRVRLAVDDALVVRADPGRVRQVVVNLLTNADRHTPHGGSITVAARAEGGAAAVEVINTGSHLAPDELARMFDRFYRADPSRHRDTGGTGLGLAIVRHLVEAQGGAVWSRSDENSVTVGFTLPLVIPPGSPPAAGPWGRSAPPRSAP
jgi:signal transduction histidine kinase